MSNVQRVVSGKTYAEKMPVASGTAIEIGSFVFRNPASAHNVIPAASVTWDTSAEQTVKTNFSYFMGISLDQHLSTEGAGNVLVATEGVARLNVSGVVATGCGAPMTIAKEDGVNTLSNYKVASPTGTGAVIGKTFEDIATQADQTAKVRFWGYGAQDQ